MKNSINTIIAILKTTALLYTLGLFIESYNSVQYNKAIIEFLMFAWIFKENKNIGGQI